MTTPLPDPQTATEIVIRALLETPAIKVIVGDRVTVAPLPTEYYAPSGPSDPMLMVLHKSESESYTLSGADGYPVTAIEVEAISQHSASEAERLGKAVITALKDYRKGDIRIMKGTGDNSEYNDEEALWRRTMEFMVRWHD